MQLVPPPGEPHIIYLPPTPLKNPVPTATAATINLPPAIAPIGASKPTATAGDVIHAPLKQFREGLPGAIANSFVTLWMPFTILAVIAAALLLPRLRRRRAIARREGPSFKR